MNFLQKAERKFGKYALKNLSLYLIVSYIAGYVLKYMSPGIYSYFTLNPYYILHGQVWRIVTWIIAPPSSLSIFTIIMLIFYYSIGTNLEHTWGAFRYNVYIFSGMLFTVIGAFVIYFVEIFLLANEGLVFVSGINEYIGTIISTMFSTYYINISIFLAFAACYPDMQVMLYFVIPIKIKWMAWFYAVFILLDFISGGWAIRTAIIASLLNFIVFFFAMFKRFSPVRVKRKHDFRKKVYKAEKTAAGGTRHKCAVCGRTELDGDDLVFRYCSKCTGNYEYCQDHLFTHEHKK